MIILLFKVIVLVVMMIFASAAVYANCYLRPKVKQSHKESPHGELRP